jgi:hypothetical protein
VASACPRHKHASSYIDNTPGRTARTHPHPQTQTCLWLLLCGCVWVDVRGWAHALRFRECSRATRASNSVRCYAQLRPRPHTDQVCSAAAPRITREYSKVGSGQVCDAPASRTARASRPTLHRPSGLPWALKLGAVHVAPCCRGRGASTPPPPVPHSTPQERQTLQCSRQSPLGAASPSTHGGIRSFDPYRRRMRWRAPCAT